MQHAAHSPYRAASSKGRDKEPLGRILDFNRDAWVVLTVTLGIAVFFHVGAFIRTYLIPVELLDWDRRVAEHVGDRLNETYEIEQEKAKPPPLPPPAPDPTPEKIDVKAPTHEAAPPPPAQAGALLTAAANPNDVEDLTSMFVSGTADTYAGGVTTTNGTGKDAVYNPNAKPNGVPGGTGTSANPQAAANAGPDRSRGIQLSNGAEWNCPFPPESEQDQIDDAYATVSVTVGIDGRPSTASIVQDPGHGFGREARACALREAFLPALGRDGLPIGSTKSFRIHFER